jgi:hypothetical protein
MLRGGGGVFTGVFCVLGVVFGGQNVVNLWCLVWLTWYFDSHLRVVEKHASFGRFILSRFGTS